MMPRDVKARAERARAARGADSIEWDGSNSSAITATTAEIFCVDALPAEQDAMVACLREWREQLGIDAHVHVIERSRLDQSSDIVSAVRSKVGFGGSSYERDVVAAVRSVGWTIIAIDRIDVDHDGEAQRWVDLRATDVIGQARRDTI